MVGFTRHIRALTGKNTPVLLHNRAAGLQLGRDLPCMKCKAGVFGSKETNMRLIKTALLGLTLAGATMASASAQPGLAKEKDINAGLLVVAVADKIRRECDSISARFFTARSYAQSLKDMASARGYSEAEIDSYINNDANQAAMRERRNAYFKSKGASNLDAQSLCVLGRAEISKKSQIGSLLKAK